METIILIDRGEILQDPGHPSGILVCGRAALFPCQDGLLVRGIPMVLVRGDDLADLANGMFLFLDGRRGRSVHCGVPQGGRRLGLH